MNRIPEGRTVLYARDQKDELQRQVPRLQAFARKQGWKDVDVVAEIGSGLNRRRKKLLHDPGVSRIVVVRLGRLARFGFDLVEAALAAAGKCIVVVEEDERVDDLARDLLEVLTSACGRLYGCRSMRDRIRGAMKAMR